MRIVVHMLSYTATDADLLELFQRYGTVTSTQVIMDRDTGRNRGFGFVEMPNNNEAFEAIVKADGVEMGGRVLRVSEAPSRPTRLKSQPRRGGRRW